MGNPYEGYFNKREILQKLADVYPDGKTTSELVNELGRHRDTIRELCNDLIADDLVIKEGKYGKYKLTFKAFGFPSYFSYSLGAKALKGIPYWQYSEDYLKSFCNTHNCKCKRIHPYNAADYEKTVAKILSEFVTRIGALITYQMIESLQFNKQTEINVGNTSNKRTRTAAMRRISMSGEFVDTLILDYAKNAIKPSLILNEFFNFIDRERGILFGEDTMRQSKETHDDKSWSFYRVGEENYKKLRNAFAIAYPNFFESMESIKKELPEIISWLSERRKNYLIKKRTTTDN